MNGFVKPKPKFWEAVVIVSIPRNYQLVNLGILTTEARIPHN